MSIKLRTPDDVQSKTLLHADIKDIEKTINSGLIDQIQFKAQTQPSTARLSAGYVYFDTSSKSLKMWDGTKWLDLVGATSGGTIPIVLTDYLYLPGRTGGQTVLSTATTDNVLNVKGIVGQSGKLQRWINSSNLVVVSVAASGNITAISATIQGISNGTSGTLQVASLSSASGALTEFDVTCNTSAPFDYRFTPIAGSGRFVFDAGSIPGIIRTTTIEIGSYTAFAISITAVPAANYSLTLPSSQGAANTFIKNNGSGTLSWATLSTGDLGTGSADATKYLRGDLTWQTLNIAALADGSNVAKLNASNTFTVGPQIVSVSIDSIGIEIRGDSSYTNEAIRIYDNAISSMTAQIRYDGTFFGTQYVIFDPLGGSSIAIYNKSSITINRTYKIDNSITAICDFVMTSGTQTIAGVKTLTGANIHSGACQIQGATLLFCDGTANRVHWAHQSDTTKKAAEDLSFIASGATRKTTRPDYDGTNVLVEGVVCLDDEVVCFEDEIVIL